MKRPWTLGCVTCHVPELPLNNPVFSEPNPFNPAGKLQVFEVANSYSVALPDGGEATGLRSGPDGTVMVPVFTDLKRHRMGEILNNETLEEEMVPTDQWLTRKLWGFANEPPFLHNGRATLISEAILAHGGEAQASRDAFANLPDDDRAAVVEFLKTLQVMPESKDSARIQSSRFDGNAIWLSIGGIIVGVLATILVVYLLGFGPRGRLRNTQ